MEIDKTVLYIVRNHKTLMIIYVFNEFRKRNINVIKIVEKLKELYGENYSGNQFIEFGEKYLNDYLIEKHGLDFNQFLLEAFKPVYHRFKHLG